MNLLALVEAHPVAALAAAALALKLPYPRFTAGPVRQALRAVLGWVFPRYYVDNDGAAYVVAFLELNGRSWGPTQSHFSNSREFVKPLGRVATVWSSVVNSRSRLFWFCGRPVYYVPPAAKKDGSGSEKPYFQVLRGTLNWTRLLELVSQYADRKLDDFSSGVSLHRVVKHVGSKRNAGEEGATTKSAPPTSTPDILSSAIKKMLHWKQEDIGYVAPEKDLDLLSLTPGMMKVVRDVGFFASNRTWYEERSIPWRRGYLLHGKPGTGKTSLVRALAEQLDVPIHIFALATMDDHDFLRAWSATRSDYRRIVLLEDFDTIFHGRDNVSQRSNLSFETVLNCIDGIERNSGLILFITTNEVDKIDKAIGSPDANTGESSRPGRIDVIAHMENLDLAGRLKIARRIFMDEKLAQEFSQDGVDEAASQFTGRCITEALRLRWATYSEDGAPAPGKVESDPESVDKAAAHRVRSMIDELNEAVGDSFNLPGESGSL